MLRKHFIIPAMLVIVFTVFFTQGIFVITNSQNQTSPKADQNNTVIKDKKSKYKESYDKNDPLFIIEKISKLTEENDIDELKELVTEVPNVYIQKSRDLMRKYLKMDEKTFNESTKEQKGKYSVSPYPISANKEELVYNAIAIINPIQEQKRKFIAVIDLKQYENEAKAIVIFGNGQPPDSKYEILLIRDPEGWKTFSFKYPNKWSATYAEKNQK